MQHITRTLTELFPRWEPTTEEAKLWVESVGAFTAETAVYAIREHRRRSQWQSPVLAEVLAIASERSRASAPRMLDSAEYARACEIARQDDEAVARAIGEYPRDVVEAAKEWLAKKSMEAQQTGRLDLIGGACAANLRIGQRFVLLTIEYRLWEKGERWWEALRR